MLLSRIFALALLLSPTIAAADAITAQVEVYFSPGGGCTAAIVREISAARKSIRVMAYSFTSADIARALVDAHKRGVAVEVVLDKSQRAEKYTSATFLANAGVSTFIDPVHAIHHNKVIVIDGGTVITGSFNFTKAAEERNAENLLVLRGGDLAARYMAEWEKHRAHSEAYSPRS